MSEKFLRIVILVLVFGLCLTIGLTYAFNPSLYDTNTEQSDETPEIEYLDFTFEGDTVTGYTGTSTEVIIPNSYSAIVENDEIKYIKGNDYSVTKVGSRLSGLNDVTSVIISEGIVELCSHAFSSSDIATIVLPNSLETISSHAFMSCRDLVSITIPASVKTLSGGVFVSCSNLSNVIFEEGCQITSINSNLFQYCRNLTNITIPASVTSFNLKAFDTCSGLQCIIFNGVTPPTISGDSFDDCTSLIAIFVPEESVEAYKSALPNYADIILANGDVSITVEK